ncbi:MAG: NAD(P)-dependent oxidoreductase, partial [Acidobacteriota bacterium]|nr:NAD(P)-dependent oxidoreductase [Acidobacteriota bacterium]
AFAVNAEGPENLGKASHRSGALLVTISTDYVFDGKKEGFYTQRDQTNPESVYAASKLDGERRAQLANARTMVVRTGFVFGPGGKNFLSTVVDRARRGNELAAISDAYGTPTYSLHLASRMSELARLDLPGIYHVVNSGPGVSYEEFARAALETGGFQTTGLKIVSTDSLNRPAPRPRNCRLRCLLSEALRLKAMPSWEEGLQEFVAGHFTPAVNSEKSDPHPQIAGR